MNARPNTLGTHLILELNDCDADALDDLGLVERTLVEAAERSGASIVGQVFHKFAPVGVTGVVSIAESHISVHTWPEYGYAAADIFTCSARFKPYAAADIIIARLKSKRPAVTEIPRGAAAMPLIAATAT